MTTAIRLYVANLGAYNAGELVGEWIDLPMDEDELREKLHNITIEEDEDGEQYGEELAIHDFEAPWGINEYDSIMRINEYAEIIARIKEEDAIIKTILGYFSTFEEGLQCLQDQEYSVYQGCDNMEDVAREYVEMSGILSDVPEALKDYFDYEAYGRDLDCDGNWISYDDGYINVYG